MQKFLEQFKNLNTRDPGAWPPVPKAMLLLGVLIGIIAMGYFLDWQEEMDSLEAGRAQEVKLKDEYVAKQQQAINLDLYRQQLREIDSSFGALLRQLPIARKWTRCSWTSTRLGSAAACNSSCSNRLRQKPSASSTPSCRSR